MTEPFQISGDESNHHGAKQEWLSEQERFEQMEITFTLRENGGCMPSSLDGWSFPVVRLLFKKFKLA